MQKQPTSGNGMPAEKAGVAGAKDAAVRPVAEKKGVPKPEPQPGLNSAPRPAPKPGPKPGPTPSALAGAKPTPNSETDPASKPAVKPGLNPGSKTGSSPAAKPAPTPAPMGGPKIEPQRTKPVDIAKPAAKAGPAQELKPAHGPKPGAESAGGSTTGAGVERIASQETAFVAKPSPALMKQNRGKPGVVKPGVVKPGNAKPNKAKPAAGGKPLGIPAAARERFVASNPPSGKQSPKSVPFEEPAVEVQQSARVGDAVPVAEATPGSPGDVPAAVDAAVVSAAPGVADAKEATAGGPGVNLASRTEPPASKSAEPGHEAGHQPGHAESVAVPAAGSAGPMQGSGDSVSAATAEPLVEPGAARDQLAAAGGAAAASPAAVPVAAPAAGRAAVPRENESGVRVRTVASAALVGISFVLEVALLGACALWAMGALPLPPIAAVLVTVVPLMVFWGLFMSPRARYRVTPGLHTLLSHALFAGGAVLLLVAGQPGLAIGMGVLTVASAALTMLVRGKDSSADAGADDRSRGAKRPRKSKGSGRRAAR